MRHGRRPAIDSLRGELQLYRDLDAQIVPPAGLTLDSPEEAEVWAALILYRAPSDWHPGALLWVHRVARLEIQLRREEELLADEGAIIVTPKGAQRRNPRVDVIDSLSKRQIAYMRACGITARPTEATQLAGRAAKFHEIKGESKRVTKPAASLLAGPANT